MGFLRGGLFRRLLLLLLPLLGLSETTFAVAMTGTSRFTDVPYGRVTVMVPVVWLITPLTPLMMKDVIPPLTVVAVSHWQVTVTSAAGMVNWKLLMATGELPATFCV